MLITSGEPQKTVNGYTRWSNDDCNCWISDENESFPQSIIYTLHKESEISSVEITTDTDLVNPRIAFWQPAKNTDQVTFTAKDVDLLIYDGEKWKKVATKTDNYLRQIIFNFKPQKAQKVKIKVNSTTGNKSVKIYEVRIYK